MEELIKRLQDFAAGTARDEDAQLAFDAVNAIEELICEVADEHNARLDAEERQRWIPVSERLPEDRTRCATVSEDDDYGLGLYTKDFGWMFPCYMGKVSHWIPLPEPPKEE